MKPYSIIAKTTLTLTLSLILSTFLLGCTQPGGNIGHYFGSWILETIDIDGERLDAYDVNADNANPVFMSFQSSLFNMGLADGKEIYGRWETTDSTLRLQGDPSEGEFPAIMGFGNESDIVFKILSQDSKRLILQRTDGSGRIWTYEFKKVI